jgi:hypothetical protein
VSWGTVFPPCVALLALAMGVRNATTRRLAIPDLTTTVLTLTLTGLAADTQNAGGEPWPTVGRRVAAVAAICSARPWARCCCARA